MVARFDINDETTPDASKKRIISLLLPRDLSWRLRCTGAVEWEPGLYIYIVTGGSAGPLQKVPYGTMISSLIKQPAKRVRVGIQLLDGADINTPLTEDTPVACGVIEVFTDKDCVVQGTEQWIAGMRGLTCGKYVFCREGYGQIQAIVRTAGKVPKLPTRPTKCGKFRG